MLVMIEHTLPVAGQPFRVSFHGLPGVMRSSVLLEGTLLSEKESPEEPYHEAVNIPLNARGPLEVRIVHVSGNQETVRSIFMPVTPPDGHVDSMRRQRWEIQLPNAGG